MRAGITRKLLLPTVFLAAIGAVLLCVAYAHRSIPVYVVQRTGETAVTASVPEDTVGEKLNINKATKEQLEELPGIGEVLAERIITYRRENGEFYDIGELREVEGIGDKLLQKLMTYICT